jgi:hypothetical protein
MYFSIHLLNILISAGSNTSPNFGAKKETVKGYRLLK